MHKTDILGLMTLENNMKTDVLDVPLTVHYVFMYGMPLNVSLKQHFRKQKTYKSNMIISINNDLFFLIRSAWLKAHRMEKHHSGWRKKSKKCLRLGLMKLGEHLKIGVLSILLTLYYKISLSFTFNTSRKNYVITISVSSDLLLISSVSSLWPWSLFDSQRIWSLKRKMQLVLTTKSQLYHQYRSLYTTES